MSKVMLGNVERLNIRILFSTRMETKKPTLLKGTMILTGKR
jgi:hypothetical protein